MLPSAVVGPFRTGVTAGRYLSPRKTQRKDEKQDNERHQSPYIGM